LTGDTLRSRISRVHLSRACAEAIRGWRSWHQRGTGKKSRGARTACAPPLTWPPQRPCVLPPSEHVASLLQEPIAQVPVMRSDPIFFRLTTRRRRQHPKMVPHRGRRKIGCILLSPGIREGMRSPGILGGPMPWRECGGQNGPSTPHPRPLR
jgi:hypothetical protein